MIREIAIFESARRVVQAERICRTSGIFVKVVPLPEKYSSECGMGLVIESGGSDFKKLMESKGIKVEIYSYEK